MSIRRNLPDVSHVMSERSIPAGLVHAASMSHPDGPATVLAAVETVGAQVREHRSSLDGRINEVQASVQNMQQVLAKLEINGMPSSRGIASESVSAKVLAEADSSMDALRSGVKKSVRMSLESFFPQAATITSSGMAIQGERDAEVYGPMRRQLSVRDLLVARRTAAPSIEYLRGTRTGSAAVQAAEGDVKAELAMSFALHTSQVRTISCWVPASRQVLDDSTMLGDYIDGELRDALRLTEDAQLLKGNGIGSNILGVWSVATAYNRGQTGDTPNDTLRRAITQVQLARGVASGIVINPEALERLELEKDTQGRYLFSYTVTDENSRASVWRVPAVVTDALAADEFMVADFIRAARLYDRWQATVEVATEHADFFTRNLVAILAEERVALTIPRPDLLITGAFPE